MKSYILAIVLTMFLSALFAFQNIGDVTIRFLIFEWTLPQGVWEVVLFSSGAAIMWFFSLFSVFEVRSKYKKELKQKDEKIAALEQEKKTILDSFVARTEAAPENRSQESGAPEAGTEE
ncbi:MAG: LapA family protein [Synergistaceae bacterium]|nr:LapA family protein [Synergistaceae bacterium]